MTTCVMHVHDVHPDSIASARAVSIHHAKVVRAGPPSSRIAASYSPSYRKPRGALWTSVRAIAFQAYWAHREQTIECSSIVRTYRCQGISEQPVGLPRQHLYMKNLCPLILTYPRFQPESAPIGSSNAELLFHIHSCIVHTHHQTLS